MRVQVESREFALKQYDLRASQNCFPVQGSLAVCRSVKIKLWVLVLLFFSLLSALMHRLINWKPRQFATPWTLCGMRRSLTVESRRKTCIAKHSGKCLEAISCSLSPSCLCLVRQTEGWLLLAEDFFSSLSISGCFVHCLQPLSHLSLFQRVPSLIFYPISQPVLTSLLSRKRS